MPRLTSRCEARRARIESQSRLQEWDQQPKKLPLASYRNDEQNKKQNRHFSTPCLALEERLALPPTNFMTI